MIDKIIKSIYDKLEPVLDVGTLTMYKPTTDKAKETDRLHIIYAAQNNEVMNTLGDCTIYEHTINITSVAAKVEASSAILADVPKIIDALVNAYPQTLDGVRVLSCRHTGNGANKFETGTLRHFNTLEFIVRYRRG